MPKNAKLLGINRTSVYYQGTSISDEELACKEIIDYLHTDNPAWGARQMPAQLKLRGYTVGRRKARRYVNEMDIFLIYPKMNLSKRMQQAKVCPCFLYLTAMIDWYSRCIARWEVDDTLDTRMVINALKKAFLVAKPQILNSDQGCQFTSSERYARQSADISTPTTLRGAIRRLTTRPRLNTTIRPFLSCNFINLSVHY